METVSVSNCQLNPIYFDSFSTCRRLRTIQFTDSRLNIEVSSRTRYSNPLWDFRELRFLKVNFQTLNRNALYTLRYLNRLEIENSEINSIAFDAFYDLERITYLSIISSKILEFDYRQILRLKSLKYLAIYGLTTNTQIDYNIFSQLPNLESVYFDVPTYNRIDLDNFPTVKKCHIGVHGQKGDNSGLDNIVNKIKKKKKTIVYKIIN